MFRSIMTLCLFLLTVILLPGYAQDLQFQREIDTIPFYINGIQVHSPFAGGMSYTKPTFADIDNDGDGDLFIGQENGQISFFRNTGTPAEAKFTFETNKFAGTDVGKFSAPTFVDIDNDGDFDLFIGELDGNINFYRNTGSAANPNFMLINETLAGIDVGAHSYPCLADIDADGDFDLFIGEEAGNINLYRNLGTAANANFVLESENYAGIDVGDFSTPTLIDIDKDNDLDLLVGEREGTVNFYRNFGSATNASYQLVTTNFAMIDVGEHSSLAFMDADNDGYLDLYTGANSGETQFYRNIDANLNLNFVYVSSQFASVDVVSHSAPAIADIDNDGNLDLFVGSYNGSVLFYRNTGIGSFVLVTSTFLNIQNIASSSTPTFVDIDNDGDLDLFVGEDVGNINFYRNIGTDSSYNFILESEHFMAIDVGDFSTPTFADIDSDGDYDLFVGGRGGSIQFYRNTGSPTNPNFFFDTSLFYTINFGYFCSPVFADIEADNDLDLFIGGQNGNIIFYRNIGTSSVPIFILETVKFLSIDVGSFSKPVFSDIDNEGNIDLLIGEVYGNIFYYSNRGATLDPVYALEIQNTNTLDFGGMSIPTFIDIDGDHDFDLFLGKADGALSLFRNTGTAQSPSFMLVTDNFSAIDVGNFSAPCFTDLDQDNDFDLLVGAENGRISFQRNTGTVTEPAFTLVTDSLCAIDVGGFSIPTLFDFNNDGYSDLFIGEKDGNLNLFRHALAPLDSMFTLVTENFASIAADSFSAPSFADIDNDSQAELLIGEKDGNLRYYRWNPADTTFTLENEHFFNIDVGQRSTPTLVDIDADGDLDLFIGEQEGGLYFYRNLTEFKPAIAISASQIDFGKVPFDSLAEKNLVIANAGTADLIIRSFSLDSTDFRLVAPPPLPYTLGPKAGSLSVTIRFKPSLDRSNAHIWLRQDTLGIHTNDPALPLAQVALQGEILTPALVTGRRILDFGPVGVDTVREDTLQIFNRGTLPLVIQSLSIRNNPSDFHLVSPSQFPVTVHSNDMPLVATIRFAPTYPGEKVDSVFARQDTLLILSNDPINGTVKVALMGNGTPTGVATPEFARLPEAFALSQNFPNPFNPETSICYQLPRSVPVKLAIFDLLGQQIRVLVDERQPAGYYAVRWTGQNDRGQQVASGIYFYRLQAGEFVEVRKLTLLR